MDEFKIRCEDDLDALKEGITRHNDLISEGAFGDKAVKVTVTVEELDEPTRGDSVVTPNGHHGTLTNTPVHPDEVEVTFDSPVPEDEREDDSWWYEDDVAYYHMDQLTLTE